MFILKFFWFVLINLKRVLVMWWNKILNKEDNTLYVLTTISNYAEYKSRYSMYQMFKEKMDYYSGIKLITVELAYEGQKHKVTNWHNPDHIQIMTNKPLWHKENLLNIALKHLPKTAKYVAWVDADIEFCNVNWVSETIAKLENYSAVQLFTNANNLNVDYNSFGDSTETGFAYRYVENNCKPGTGNPDPNSKEPFYGAGFFTNGKFWHPGYAWAFRLDFLRDIGGFYDYNVLGEGDHTMANAFIGTIDRLKSDFATDGYWQTALDYQNRVQRSEYFKGINYINGTIIHHYHGSKNNRGYISRKKLYGKYNYNPQTDLIVTKQGLYSLDLSKERLINLSTEIENYFLSRKEDDK